MKSVHLPNFMSVTSTYKQGIFDFINYNGKLVDRKKYINGRSISVTRFGVLFSNKHYLSIFFFGLVRIDFELCSSHDVTPITMALNGAAGWPQASQALMSMLSRNQLNPADITVLFRNYSAHDPPPIDLIRNPQFLGKHFEYFN